MILTHYTGRAPFLGHVSIRTLVKAMALSLENELRYTHIFPHVISGSQGTPERLPWIF